MKLSEIQGERVFDVIADIIEPVCNIAGDDEAAVLFKKQPLPKDMTVKAFIMKRVTTSAPKLLKNHKRDLMAINAAIKGVGVEEYGKTLNLAVLIKDITELLTDEMFTQLFISSGNAEGGVVLENASENIKAKQA